MNSLSMALQSGKIDKQKKFSDDSNNIIKTTDL